MELEELRQNMKKVLKENRYRHVLGVEAVSYDLALLYGYDTKQASIAGILHDCARNLSDEELLEECEKYHLILSDAERKNASLLHAKVGAAHARDKYQIEDPSILNAITYHTTGRPEMTLIEKIIFTADYIEPTRKNIPRMDEIRRKAYENLDQAVLMILENTLNYLQKTDMIIDILTNETYEYYKNKYSSQ